METVPILSKFPFSHLKWIIYAFAISEKNDNELETERKVFKLQNIHINWTDGDNSFGQVLFYQPVELELLRRESSSEPFCCHDV